MELTVHITTGSTAQVLPTPTMEKAPTQTAVPVPANLIYTHQPYSVPDSGAAEMVEARRPRHTPAGDQRH